MNASVLEIQNGLYVARFVGGRMEWGVGPIQPQPEYAGREPELAQVVVDSIEEVAPEEMQYSCCTDGRCPRCLQDGLAVPVREQLVGADAMMGFHMAETLGARFYSDPNAPVEVRLAEALDYLDKNGFKGTHMSCGMAEHYITVLANTVMFAGQEEFNDRNKLFLPSDVYDDRLAQENIAGIQKRLDAGLYKGYSGKLILDTVRQISGDHAVAELIDDGRGVHGHVEELIVRIRRGIMGFAVNEKKVYETTGRREVFVVNDDRIDRLAQIFGRGKDEDYRRAYIAGEQATNGGHGTLSKNLPTLEVALAA